MGEKTPGDALADKMTELVGKAQVPNTEHIQGLIRWAGYHLDSALVGKHLFDTRDVLPFPQHIADYASLNLVFRSAASCLDLSAAAIYWLSDGAERLGTKEADCETLARRMDTGVLTVAAPVRTWFRSMRSRNEWRLLTSSRDYMTHRHVQMYLDVQMGRSIRSMMELDGHKHYTDDLVKNAVGFGAEQFKAFSAALEETLT